MSDCEYCDASETRDKGGRGREERGKEIDRKLKLPNSPGWSQALGDPPASASHVLAGLGPFPSSLPSLGASVRRPPQQGAVGSICMCLPLPVTCWRLRCDPFQICVPCCFWKLHSEPQVSICITSGGPFCFFFYLSRKCVFLSFRVQLAFKSDL